MKKKTFYSVLITFMAVVITACTQQRDNSLLQKMQWPAPPASAKIQYIRSFSTPDELGIERSFWQKVGDFFAGQEINKMIRPMAIVVSDKGVIYVADPGAYGVHRFNIKQQRYDLIALKGGRPLVSPVALGRDSQGNVYVSDSKQALIYRISSNDGFAVPFMLNKTLKQPTGLLFHHHNGNLYVVDTGQHKVFVFSPQGEFISAFGGRGVDEGRFNYPTMITQNDNGQLLVTDSMNFRIQIFDENGVFIKSFGQHGDASGYMSRPKGIAADDKGHIYVVDSLFHTVQLFDENGRYLMKIGEQGRRPGEFWLPTGIFIDRNKIIYVADSHNHRVQVFRILGAVQ